MKRIGILTFHKTINYGAFLQCYSLSKKLQESFPNYKIEVIDYVRFKAISKPIFNILKITLKKGIGNLYTEYVKYYKFRKSIKTLPLSDKKIISNDYKKAFNYMKNRYDAIIVGSDAIFNINQAETGFPNAFLLNDNFNCPKLSYAASAHGMYYEDFSLEQLTYCKESFDDFSYIGVRDKNTEQFIKYCNSNLNVEHNCDPTVFLDMNFETSDLYNKLIHKYNINLDKPIIALMLKNDEIARVIRERYGDKYTIITLFNNSKYADKYIYDLSPYEWAKIFSYAKLTFTEYFHGALLSLKNLTPTIIIDSSKYSGDYESKFKDLFCTRFKLDEFYYKVEDLDNQEILEKIFTISKIELDNPSIERISEAIEKEANYYYDFETALKKILDL